MCEPQEIQEAFIDAATIIGIAFIVGMMEKKMIKINRNKLNVFSIFLQLLIFFYLKLLSLFF